MIENKRYIGLKILIILIFLFVNISSVISQSFDEGDDVTTLYNLYYHQRSEPYDTIPQDAYKNAVAQREAMKSNGFALPNSWNSIGPEPFDWNSEWPLPINSGRVNNVIYDPTGSIIYITGAEGGVFKTVDGGVTWQEISGDLPTLSSGALTLDASNGTLYYGSGDPWVYYGSGKGLGVYKTTDQQHWTNITVNSQTFPKRTAIYRIAINPNNPNNIFVAEYSGLWETMDGGNNWFQPPSITIQGNCTDVCFSPDGNYVYAIGASPNFWPGTPFNGIGYWRSTNQGNTFSPVNSTSGFPHFVYDPYGRSCLAVSKAQNAQNYLYILSYDNYSSDNCVPFCDRMYVYKSTDFGLSFSSYTYYYSSQEGYNWNGGVNAGYDQVIKCSNVDPNICFMGFVELFRTTNGGLNWSNINLPFPKIHSDYHALDFNPDPNHSDEVTLGCDGGVFRFNGNGDNNVSLNQNLSFSELWALASDKYDPACINCGLQDYGFGCKYPSNGPTYWKGGRDNACVEGGDGSFVLGSPFKPYYFIGGVVATKDIFYSTINPECFQTSNNYSFSSHVSAFPIPAIANHPDQPGVSFLVEALNDNYCQTYVLKSTDYGVNWHDDAPYSQFVHTFDNVGPNQLAISPSNPNTMIMGFGNMSLYWENQGGVSRLIKSTDGGVTWNLNPILTGGQNGFPERYFTHVEFDGANENEIYLTLSGYDAHHVWRSMDGGNSWNYLDGTQPNNLPDAPVNDMIIHYTGPFTKEIIVATDVGVYRTDVSPNSQISWKLLASGLPNTSIFKLDYNRLSGILRCSAFGRGAYETQLNDGAIFVPDKLYITNNVTLNKPIDIEPGGNLILGLSSVNNSIGITFNLLDDQPGIVVDGGQINAASGAQILFNSGNQRCGIEIINGGMGHFNNCTFEDSKQFNIDIDYSIGGSNSPGQNPYISIDNCVFSNSSININAENTIPAYITNNTFYGCDPTLNTTIQLNNSDPVYIMNNTISNTPTAISLSNSNAEISNNVINISNVQNSYGISMDNCGNPWIRNNSITSDKDAIYNYTSSPSLLQNMANGINSSSVACYWGSYPILSSASPGDGTSIWVAGLNQLESGIGILEGADNYANYAIIDKGKNHFDNSLYYISANWLPQPYLATGNCWDGGEPDPNKFYTGEYYVTYDPNDCSQLGSIFKDTNFYEAGGNEYSLNQFLQTPVKEKKISSSKPELEPLTPYILDRGHGHYDTIKVTSRNLNLSPSEALLSQGVKQELQNNFTDALNIYKSIVQNYHDSITAIKAAIKMLPCVDKIINDTGKYTSLGNYYLGVIQNYPNDTMLRKVSNLLSRKVLVKKRLYVSAINGFENDIQHTTDSLEILCYQLNIVETYMLMPHGNGNSVSFTGKYKELKPATRQDGFRMISDLLRHKKLQNKVNPIPKEFKISQNYPNPFNPTTKIDYQLPNASKVTIKVYDILGKLVKTLVNNEQKDAGYYSVVFDGNNFASGVYFYRIDAGKFTNVKKMVLVK